MTNTKATLASLAAALVLAGCQSVYDLPTERFGSASLTLANGVPTGTVQLVGSGDTLSLAIAATGLPAGEHGFHLHTTGQCQRPDFSSAGGHLNPTDEGHGLGDDDGSHVGDLPNLLVPSSGTVSTTVDLRGTRTNLLDYIFDTDGTAVIIHADPDDGTSEPSGNAGARIACGVMTRSG